MQCFVIAWFSLSATIAAPPHDPKANLDSPRPSKRHEAAQQLSEQRQEIIQAANAVLIKNIREKSIPADSPAVTAAQVLAEYEAVSAAGILLDNIDVRIRASDRRDIPLPQQFPLARALIRIGGFEVLSKTVETLAEEYRTPRKRLLTWVVYGVAGVEMGMRQLERAALNRRDEEAKRLRAAAEGLSTGEKILDPFQPKAEVDAEKKGLSMGRAGCRLPRKAIFKVIRQDTPYWKMCIQQVIEDRPNIIPRHLRLSFTITADGQLTEFKVLNRGPAKKALYPCLSRLFTTMSFPTSKGSNCRIEDWKIPLKTM